MSQSERFFYAHADFRSTNDRTAIDGCWSVLFKYNLSSWISSPFYNCRNCCVCTSKHPHRKSFIYVLTIWPELFNCICIILKNNEKFVIQQLFVGVWRRVLKLFCLICLSFVLNYLNEGTKTLLTSYSTTKRFCLGVEPATSRQQAR